MMTRRPLICLTPVKNESWILEPFLQAAAAWADNIIIADQGSDDGSREIAARHSKVWLIDNREQRFNEPERQRLLIDAARSRWPDAILIALDADEMLAPSFGGPSVRARLAGLPPGTNLRMCWHNVQPGMQRLWRTPHLRVFGFVDDGTAHQGMPIHSPRVPLGTQPLADFTETPVYHFQFVDWERMVSKHRWYQCHERVIGPASSAVAIYRQYHHMHVIPRSWDAEFPAADLRAFSGQGVELDGVRFEGVYRWDAEVLKLFAQHGAAVFRREAIWSADWAAIAQRIPGAGLAVPTDPRRPIDRWMHAWLSGTQRFRRWVPVWAIDRILGLLWR